MSAGTALIVCLLAGSPAGAQDPGSAFPPAVPEDPGAGGSGGVPAVPDTSAPHVPGTEAPGEADDEAPILNDAAPPEGDAMGGDVGRGGAGGAGGTDGTGVVEEDPFAGSEELDEALTGEEVVAPPAGKGVVRGTVISTADGEPVIEARVQLEGTKTQTLTNLDGQYALELEPGRYRLRYWYPLHQARVIPDVDVKAGETTTIDVALEPEGAAIQVVEVVEQADRAKAAVQIEKRRRAAVVSDAISGEEIARTPDSSAADATRRVVGATIVGGKFLVIRGLGGRYSLALMRGVPLPSPEPDEPVIPLDIFPASLLSSVVIAKTATPDLPGNFAGGALIIDPKQYPDRFTLQLKAELKGDTWSTFSEAPAPPDGGMDALGRGPEGRDGLPAGLPDERVDTDSYPRNTPRGDQRNGFGKEFTSLFGSEEQTVPLGVGLGASVGDTVSLLGKRLGYVLHLSWGDRYDAESTHEIVPTYDDGEPTAQGATADYVQRLGKETVSYGALGALSFRIADGQDLSLTSFLTSTNDDIAAVQFGYRAERGGDVERTRLQLLQRSLFFNQLSGSHVIASLNRAELDWQVNVGKATRDEPDTRDTTYVLDTTTGQLINASGVQGGAHLNLQLEDEIRGAGADFTVPFRTPWDTKLGEVRPKIGVLYSRSERTYRTRNFLFLRSNKLNSQIPEQYRLQDRKGPNEHITDGSIGTFWEFEENTQVSNSYDAQTESLAGYALIDTPIVRNLRLIAGVRYETYLTQLQPGQIFDADLEEGRIDRKEEDFLPSANLVYSLTPRTNLRLAYAETLVRPQLRELACEVVYYDFVRNRAYNGNCDLRRALIHNLDLRIEYFPGATEVLAASVFGKRFIGAIENVIYEGTSNSITFVNADEAILYGAELEARVSLGRLDGALEDFGLTSNLTLVHSRVEMSREKARQTTNLIHPLQGQSPYVINLGLLYQNHGGTEIGVLYNVFGRRLDALGSDGTPDRYEQPFHTLDATASQKLPAGFVLKLGLTNLLNQDHIFVVSGERVKDFETSRYSPGLGASATLSWSM